MRGDGGETATSSQVQCIKQIVPPHPASQEAGLPGGLPWVCLPGLEEQLLLGAGGRKGISEDGIFMDWRY